MFNKFIRTWTWWRPWSLRKWRVWPILPAKAVWRRSGFRWNWAFFCDCSGLGGWLPWKYGRTCHLWTNSWYSSLFCWCPSPDALVAALCRCRWRKTRFCAFSAVFSGLSSAILSSFAQALEASSRRESFLEAFRGVLEGFLGVCMGFIDFLLISEGFYKKTSQLWFEILEFHWRENLKTNFFEFSRLSTDFPCDRAFFSSFFPIAAQFQRTCQI